MDQEALVDQVLEDGARLDLELSRRGHTLGSPVAAYDLNAGQWALLFSFSSRMSRRQIYEEAQTAIEDLGLQLSLDHVVLVKDADPGMRELQDLAVSTRSLKWENSTPPVEVAGRVFNNPQVVRISPLQFEEAVWQALQSVLSDDYQLSRDDSFLLDSRSERVPDVRHPRRMVRVDFAAIAEDSVVLIEVKAARRPLSSDRVLAALGQLSYYRHEIGVRRSVSLVLVSMSDFNQAVKREFEDLEGFVLVAWAMGQDRAILAEAVARAAGTRSGI